MKLSIEVDQESKGLYKAMCKILPGCAADGSTPHEAVRNLRYAISGYMAAVNHCAELSLQGKKLQRHQALGNARGMMASHTE